MKLYIPLQYMLLLVNLNNMKLIFHIKHITEISIERISIFLKLFVNFLAIIAGKTIKLEINNVPIILIPNTTTIAVINEIKNVE